MRGQFIQALKSNVGGTMLAVVAALFGPWSVISAIAGRPVWKSPGQWGAIAMGSIILFVTLIDWTVRYFLT